MSENKYYFERNVALANFFGQGTVSCNECRTPTHCKGMGLIPKGVCDGYVAPAVGKFRFADCVSRFNGEMLVRR